mmetsp:Transcript_84241/g.239004  ORF Transcript_84241/g.239004 Transcript_84241/m.239004 type:complete len:236 (+) Transcript_84241:453-1160(+)
MACRRIVLSEKPSPAKASTAAPKTSAARANCWSTAATPGSASAISKSSRRPSHSFSMRALATSSMRRACCRTSASSGSKRSASHRGARDASKPADLSWARRRLTFVASWSRGSNFSSLAIFGRCLDREASAIRGGPAGSSAAPPGGAARLSHRRATASLKGEEWPSRQKPPDSKLSRSLTVQTGRACPETRPGANICVRMCASSCSSRTLLKNEPNSAHSPLYSRLCTSVSCVRT